MAHAQLACYRGGMVLLMALSLSMHASAQSLPVGVYISVSGGIAQPATDSLTRVAAESDGFNREEVRTVSRLGRSGAFDIGGGVVLRKRITIGAAFDRSSSERPADVTLSLTHPAFHPTLTATKVSDPLQRNDSALHVQFGYKVPTREPLSLTFFGGPSYFTTRQEALTGINWREPFNSATRSFSATIGQLETGTVHASAWGYNVGVDGGYFFSKHVGVGGMMRYGRATVDLENPLESMAKRRTVSDEAQAGGLRTAAGLRVRF